MSLLRRAAFRNQSYTLSKFSREDQIKIGFQYILVSLLAFAVGFLLCKAVPQDIRRSAEQAIAVHFEIPFRYVSSWKEVLLLVLDYAKKDLLFILTVFLSSLTVLSIPISELLLFLQCGVFGITTSLLLQAGQSALYPPNPLQIFGFVAFRSLFLILSVFYAWKAASFSQSIRSFMANGRMAFNHRFFLRFAADTFTVAGTVLFICCGYCFFIFEN